MSTGRGSLPRQAIDGVGRLLDLGVEPTDTSQERTAKASLTLAALLLGFFAGAWTLSYFLLDLTSAGLIVLVYQASLLLALGHFVLTRRFAGFRFATLSLHLVTPIAVQAALGGFHQSSGVALWSLVAPLGAILAYGSRGSIRWFAAYVALVGASAAMDASRVTSGAHVPTAAVATFFVANVVGVSAVVYLLVRYFVRERDRTARALAEQHLLLAEEQRRSEGLLLNILPAPVAERLKQHEGVIADRIPDASILFADIVGFTEWSEQWPPERVVDMLNRLFTAFDELADAWDLDKVKTIGDAYMLAGGLHAQRDHPLAVAHMARAMQREARRQRAGAGFALDLRIGIATGPVVAGVIGRSKFAYDIWGDTVNMASRMESTGTAGSIQVSETAYERLRGDFGFQRREHVMVKGKGEVTTYILLGESSGTTATEATQT